MYVDSNIFLSPLIYERSKKGTNARRIFRMIERSEITAYTSTITWDEVVWVVGRILGGADSIQAGERLTSFPNLRFIPASEQIVRAAQRLVAEHDDLAPRDAIHIASALIRMVDVIVSDDSDLDVVRTVRRKSSDAFVREVTG